MYYKKKFHRKNRLEHQYRNCTLVSVPDTKTGFWLHTLLLGPYGVYRSTLVLCCLSGAHFMFSGQHLSNEPLVHIHYVTKCNKYRKVASSRTVYYSIFNSLGQRLQYIIIKFPHHKQSSFLLRCATNRDNLLLATLRQVICWASRTAKITYVAINRILLIYECTKGIIL